MPEVRRAYQETDLLAGDSVQGQGLVRDRLCEVWLGRTFESGGGDIRSERRREIGREERKQIRECDFERARKNGEQDRSLEVRGRRSPKGREDEREEG